MALGSGNDCSLAIALADRRMNDLDEILAAAARAAERGEPVALATVVSVKGSSYRRPGARLLVPAEGSPIGL
ncbi:MAG: XdhC family protein, partial [Candidatus Limnocylindria bacterium]